MPLMLNKEAMRLISFKRVLNQAFDVRSPRFSLSNKREYLLTFRVKNLQAGEMYMNFFYPKLQIDG